ncbi:MAG: carbohydrate binding domain-containing protein [Defluviitaleaceae bacterium]|nr:carbohydrate binding domain-containing protein [Defluviitaleaceae bacterium]
MGKKQGQRFLGFFLVLAMVLSTLAGNWTVKANAAPGPGYASDNGASAWVGAHPRVFFQAKDIPAIYAKRTQTQQPIPDNTVDKQGATDGFSLVWQAIVDQSNGSTGSIGTGYNANLLNVIQAGALLYAMDKTTYLAKGQNAASLAAQYAATYKPASGDDRNMDNAMLILGEAYDWCYDLFTPAQLAAIRKAVWTIADTSESGSPTTTDGDGNTNHTGPKMGTLVGHGAEEGELYCQLAAGIAMYDEDPTFLDALKKRIDTVFVPERDILYISSDNAQGDSYGPGRYSNDLFCAALYEGLGLGNPFDSSQADFLKKNLIYLRRPDGQVMRSGDSYWSSDYARGWYWNYDQMMTWLAASLWQDPTLWYEANRDFTNPVRDPVMQLMLRNPQVEPITSYSDLPNTVYWGGLLPAMMARTGGYTDTKVVNDTTANPNIAIAYMNMPQYYFGNHQHLDAGSFQLYYKGYLAIDAGMYEGTGAGYGTDYDMNYAKQSIAHNTIAVYDPNETFNYYGQSLANNGGQRTANNMQELNTLDDYLNNPATEISQVIGHDFGGGADPVNNPLYSYLAGDLTDAYSSKVSDYKRSFAFLNLGGDVPAALIVYDAVTSSDANFQKSWLLNTEEQPVVSAAGDQITVEKTPKPVTSTTNLNYNGKLVDDVLLPANPSTTVVKTTGGVGWDTGVNYGAIDDTTMSGGVSVAGGEFGNYRVQVSPSAAAKSDSFLNVLQVMDKGTSALASTPYQSGPLTGAVVSNWMVMFSKTGNKLSQNLTVQTQAGTANVLITGLQEGDWSVSDGAASTAYTVTADAGTIYFQAAPNTAYTITPGDSVTKLPVIDSVTYNNSLLIEGGVTGTMTLDGVNFTGAAFSLVPDAGAPIDMTAYILSRTDAQITATIPASLAAGSYKIQLTLDGNSVNYSEALLIGSSSGPAPVDDNIIANGSFETGSLSPWAKFRSPATNPIDYSDPQTVTLQSDDVKDGNVAVAITNRTHYRQGIQQDITTSLNAAGPGVYEFSGWIKLTGANVPKDWSGGLDAGAYITLNDYGDNFDDTGNAVGMIGFNADNGYDWDYNLPMGPLDGTGDTGWVYFDQKILLNWDGSLSNAAVTLSSDWGWGSTPPNIYADGLKLVKVKSGIDSVSVPGGLSEGNVSGNLVVTGSSIAQDATVTLKPYYVGTETTITDAAVSGDGTALTAALPAGLPKGVYQVILNSNGTQTAAPENFSVVVMGNPPVIDPSELFTNPSMEDGTANGWFDGSGIVSMSYANVHYDPANGYDGMFAVKVARSAGWQGPGQDVTAALQKYGAGTYQASAWAKLAAGQNTQDVAMTLMNTTAGGSNPVQYPGFGDATVTDSAWTQISGTLTLSPDGITQILPYVSQCLIKLESDNAFPFYADDFSFKRVPPSISGVSLSGTDLTVAGASFSPGINKVYLVPETGEPIDITSGITSNSVAQISLTVPGDIPAGTYQVRVDVADLSSNLGNPPLTFAEQLSGDASLSLLTVSAGTLTPDFDAEVTEYTVDVENGVDSVDIAAVASDPNAEVTGDIGTMALAVGANVFTVTVTAEDGTIQDYTVTVNRAAPPVDLSKYDLNGDGKVDASDLTFLMSYLNKKASSSAAAKKCDLDGDGIVTMNDYAILAGVIAGL